MDDMKLKPYPEYKESGVPWLGKVPGHWEVFPNRALFYERNSKNQTEKDMLSVVITRGVIPQKELISNTSKKDSSNDDKSNYKLVKKGDLAYNKMRMWQGAVGASNYEGIVSPAYIVIHSRNEANSWYYHFLFRSPAYIKESHRYSYGICDDQLSLRFGDFKQLYSPVPPTDEQWKIVKYIEFNSSQISRFIRAKKRMIELLKEQKQAIINDAVTGKIDVRTGKPYPKYKESGVEWLGKVPKDWEVKRISWLFNERNESGRTGLPILIVSLRTGVTEGSDYDEDGRPRKLIADVEKYKFADQGDIAYNMMRMWQGAVGVVPVPGLVSPAYVVARALKEICTKYYEVLFRTKSCKNEINNLSRGIVSDRNRLYYDQFKRIYCPFPSLIKQREIIDYIDNETKKLSDKIDLITHEISLLQEYRTRLIADVVTGKLDVRGIDVPDVVDGIDDTVEAVDPEENGEELVEEEVAELQE